MKHTKNIYFLYKEVGTTLKYRIILNIDEKNKSSIYEKEKQGFKVCKILANE